MASEISSSPIGTSFAHDNDSIGEVKNLVEVGRDKNDGLPIRHKGAHHLVDFGAGTDINAAGGLVKDEDVDVAEKPLPDDDLLLISSRRFLTIWLTDGVLTRVHRHGVESPSDTRFL